MRTSKYPYIVTVAYSGFQGCKYFVWTWFAAYLVSVYGIKITNAGLLWAFVAAVPAALCQPLAGLASDKIGRVKTLVISLLVTVVLCLLFTSFSLLGPAVIPVWALIVTAVVFSIFVNMWVLVWPFTTTMFPTAAAGPIGGVMNTVAQFVGSTAPVISGYAIDATHSYTPVFVAGAACAAIGLVAATRLRDVRVV